jgi:hypothetical protein
MMQKGREGYILSKLFQATGRVFKLIQNDTTSVFLKYICKKSCNNFFISRLKTSMPPSWKIFDTAPSAVKYL